MHKKMCMNIMEARKQAKDPQRESAVKLAIGLTRSEGGNMMKRWVQFYRPLLMSMVKHALKLQTDEPLRDHYLYFKLVPKFTAATVPITDHDLINAFRAEDISVRSIKQLLIDTPDFKPMYYAVLEREKNMAAQGQDHIICVVPVMISTPVFDNIRFAPFGVAGPKEYMDPYNLRWKQDLERGIEKAAPCGCRVCLHI